MTMLFHDLDEATRRKAIAFLEASLAEEAKAHKRKVLHLDHPAPRRSLRGAANEPLSSYPRCA